LKLFKKKQLFPHPITAARIAMDETHATLSSTTTSLLQGKDVLNMHDEPAAALAAARGRRRT
jgi:hypothetical protein